MRGEFKSIWPWSNIAKRWGWGKEKHKVPTKPSQQSGLLRRGQSAQGGKLNLEEEGGFRLPKCPVWKEKWRQRLTVPASRQPPWFCSRPGLYMEKCAVGSGPFHQSSLLSRARAQPTCPCTGLLDRLLSNTVDSLFEASGCLRRSQGHLSSAAQRLMG